VLNQLFKDGRVYLDLLGFFVIETLLSFWAGQPYGIKIWFNMGVWMNQVASIKLSPGHSVVPWNSKVFEQMKSIDYVFHRYGLKNMTGFCSDGASKDCLPEVVEK
jgi:hypothetical protein